MQLGLLPPSLPHFTPPSQALLPGVDPTLVSPLPHLPAEEPVASLPTAPQQPGASPSVSLPAMEHLALGLVWLLGMLATVSSKCGRELDMDKLDMAPNSFDDQYLGCSTMMEKELKELNRTELDAKTSYSKAFEYAAAALHSHGYQWQVLKPVQAIALMAYTLENPPLYKEFNAAVRDAGRSREQYLQNFPYKVLHFLLTEALRALRDAQPHQCYDVYRGVKNTFTAQPGETVRFGQFASTSLEKKCAEGFGKATIFTVNTCYGVPIKNFSAFLGEEEVLIPPFEIFEVTSVTHKGNSALIELRSQGVHSKYNCEFVKGHSVTLAPLWGFILAATALATALGI
ncbi:erythroblast NAD(P)(+)--arginine ADP-ribosyltransferase-like isoform 2-T3 [Porphyrio hochstetteri]